MSIQASPSFIRWLTGRNCLIVKKKKKKKKKKTKRKKEERKKERKTKKTKIFLLQQFISFATILLDFIAVSFILFAFNT